MKKRGEKRKVNENKEKEHRKRGFVKAVVRTMSNLSDLFNGALSSGTYFSKNVKSEEDRGAENGTDYIHRGTCKLLD